MNFENLSRCTRDRPMFRGVRQSTRRVVGTGSGFSPSSCLRETFAAFEARWSRSDHRLDMAFRPAKIWMTLDILSQRDDLSVWIQNRSTPVNTPDLQRSEKIEAAAPTDTVTIGYRRLAQKLDQLSGADDVVRIRGAGLPRGLDHDR